MSEIDLIKVLDECIETKEINLALNLLYNVKETFSRYDEYMKKTLDLLLQENNLNLVLNTLRASRNYFSAYDEYLEKTGMKIK